MQTEAGPAISRGAWRTFAVVSICGFQTSLSISIVNVAFPSLRDSFPEVSSAQLSWVINAYTIVAAALLVVAGAWGDRVGRKRVLLTGVGGFAVSSVACALAPTVPFLIGARCVQAASSAMVTPMSAALIARAFPPQRRATAVALWAGVGGVAAALGPSVGGFLIDAGGWRWAFWVLLPGGLIGFTWGLRAIEESRDPDGRDIPDLFGAVILMSGVSLVVLGVVQSRQWGWGDQRTLGSLAVGLTLVAWLLVRSARHPRPILDLRLFRYRDFTVANLGTASFGVPFFAMFLGYLVFLTEVWGYSTRDAGLLVVPMPLAIAILAPVAGRVADRHGHRVLMVAGGFLFALGGAWMWTLVEAEPDRVVWLIGMSIQGLGGAFVWPSIYGATLVSLPAERFASATGINQTIQRITTALGVALAILIIGDTTPDGLGDYPALFALTTFGGVAAMVVGTLLSRGAA